MKRHNLCCYSIVPILAQLSIPYANWDAALNLSMLHLQCHLHTQVHSYLSTAAVFKSHMSPSKGHCTEHSQL